MSASVFERVGIVRVTSGGGAVRSGALFSIGGSVSGFGILQSFELSDKVSVQVKRTLRNMPIVFPTGDEFSDISVLFIAPQAMLCGNDVGTWTAAAKTYDSNKVKPGGVTPVTVGIGSLTYKCLVLGLQVSGALSGALPVVTVSLRMIGRRTGVS